MADPNTTAMVLTAELRRRIKEMAAAQTTSESAIVRQALAYFFAAQNGKSRETEQERQEVSA